MKGIPVQEFVELEAKAHEAYKQGDWATIAQVNNRLADINISIYWNGAEAYLAIHNPDEVLKPEGDTP